MGGYLGFCVKACAGGALALVIALVPITSRAPAARVAPAPAPSQLATSQYTSAQAASLTATARTLEPYLVRQSNGTLTLNAPNSVINGLPMADVRSLGTGLSALNAKIAAGQLLTNPAGAVFDPSTDRLMFQGGWTGFGNDWWHAYLCLNHDDVQRVANYGIGALSAAALAAIAYISAATGVVFAVLLYGYSGWLYLADRGNGSCLNFGHWAPPNMWVTSQ